MARRFIFWSILIAFTASLMNPCKSSWAGEMVGNLPAPGTMVNLSSPFEPVLMKGLKIHPENPFLFDFIIDPGSDHLAADSAVLKEQTDHMIKYFLTSMTIPEKDLWVNLSPYEKDRMITETLGKTQMGKEMLAQDYILKQLTASLIYPEKALGKSFWEKVYSKAQTLYGTTQIPINTFNKVWIVADKADVFERKDTAYVVGAHLKVMLEEDYLAKKKHDQASSSNISSEIIREIIIPEIEKEVNTGRNFASLRQIFYSMILASWYKNALKDAVLSRLYGDQNKVSVGVNADDPKEKEKIFERYLEAYKKGVFNYIKDDMEKQASQPVARKYFSGGEHVWGQLGHARVVSSLPPTTDLPDNALIATVDMTIRSAGSQLDAAMTVMNYEKNPRRFAIQMAKEMMLADITQTSLMSVASTRLVAARMVWDNPDLFNSKDKKLARSLIQEALVSRTDETRIKAAEYVLSRHKDLAFQEILPLAINNVIRIFGKSDYPIQAAGIILQNKEISEFKDYQVQALEKLSSSLESDSSERLNAARGIVASKSRSLTQAKKVINDYLEKIKDPEMLRTADLLSLLDILDIVLNNWNQWNLSSVKRATWFKEVLDGVLMNKETIRVDPYLRVSGAELMLTYNDLLKDRAMTSSIDDHFSDAFRAPIVLTDTEIRQYLGEKTLTISKAKGQIFYVRQLDPDEDTKFIKQWEKEFKTDSAWQEQWKEANGYDPVLPYFHYIESLTLGLFSKSDAKERLEGLIGVDPQAASYDYSKRVFLNGFYIGQIETYYKNIGTKGEIKGISDLLFDMLIKFCAAPDHNANQWIKLSAVTPGSKAFFKRRGLTMIDDTPTLTMDQIKEQFASRNLTNLFNGPQGNFENDQAMQSDDIPPQLMAELETIFKTLPTMSVRTKMFYFIPYGKVNIPEPTIFIKKSKIGQGFHVSFVFTKDKLSTPEVRMPVLVKAYFYILSFKTKFQSWRIWEPSMQIYDDPDFPRIEMDIISPVAALEQMSRPSFVDSDLKKVLGENSLIIGKLEKYAQQYIQLIEELRGSSSQLSMYSDRLDQMENMERSLVKEVVKTHQVKIEFNKDSFVWAQSDQAMNSQEIILDDMVTTSRDVTRLKNILNNIEDSLQAKPTDAQLLKQKEETLLDIQALQERFGRLQRIFNGDSPIKDDQAMKSMKDKAITPGGIDFDRTNMQMNVRKEGKGVQMQFDPAMVERIKREGFEGLEFHIQSIVPIANLPLLLGLDQEVQKLATVL